MSRGGARNRSGPTKQEGSTRSDREGYVLTALPAAGYTGEAPKWPLSRATARELVVWRASWKTPQACAWSLPTEAWRVPTVAMWVRLRVRCEDREAPAAIFAQLHRFADQIGMTTAGLAEMGWKITEPPEHAAEAEPDASSDQQSEATGTDGTVVTFTRRR